MLWVVVFVALALAGLAMAAGYAVWLVHKGADLWSEVAVLADRADELATLVGQIRMPEAAWSPDETRDLMGVDADQFRP